MPELCFPGQVPGKQALSAQELRHLYEQFCAWGEKNQPKLEQWVLANRADVDRGFGFVIDQGPLFKEAIRDSFWFDRPGIWPETSILRDDVWQFLFCIFARGHQYNVLFGSNVPYFPHPLRVAALPSSAPRKVATWSWGRAVLHILRSQKAKERKEGELLDLVRRLREAARAEHARWADLAGVRDKKEIKERLLRAATRARLGASNEWLDKVLDIAALAFTFTAEQGLERLLEVQSPLYGVGVDLLILTFHSEIKLLVQGLPLVRKEAHFPGLLDEDE